MKLAQSILTLIFGTFLSASAIGFTLSAHAGETSTLNLAVGSKVVSFESGFLKVGDVDYHYLAKGEKDRPLMLFLHGFPEIAAAWKDQMATLSKYYYTVAIDMKGANLTSIPDATDKFANYSAAQLATEVNTLALSITGGKPYFLVGHDWGATVAWNVGFSFPSSLRALVVINGAHSLQYFREYFSKTDSFQFDAAAYIRNIISGIYTDQFYLQNNSAELRDVLFDNPIGGARRFFNSEMRELYMKYWQTPGSVNAGMNYYRAINFGLLAPLYADGMVSIEKNEAPFLKKYHVQKGLKTLVIWGEKDIYISPKVNDGLVGFFNDPSDLTIKKYSKYSHWIVHENSAQVTRDIRNFVRGK